MAKTLTSTSAPGNEVNDSGYAVGTPVTSAGISQTLPSIEGHGAKYFLGHSAKSWELTETDQGWELLPILKPYYLVPGCNWVDHAPKGVKGADPVTTKTRVRLDEMHVQLLTDIEQYLKEIKGLNGPAYFLTWERVRIYDDGDWEMEFDHQGYNAWRRGLVADGTIAPPRRSVVGTLRKRLKARINRIGSALHLPKAQAQMKVAEAMLAGLNDATNPPKTKKGAA